METVIKFIVLLFLIISAQSFGATCTSISRTNNSANAVLTSTKYNTDLNTVYTAANALDGGCITDATLEDDALNTTDFAALLNGLTDGCIVAYSDANTLSVGKCRASVNGAFVRTTVATTVTWLCSGCSAEASSTYYFLYIKTGSTGSTLNLLISTSAPNEDGYDSSGNKVLAKFYNSSGSDIFTQSIVQWVGGKGFVFTDNIVKTRLNSAGGFLITYSAVINCDAGSSVTSSYGVTVHNAAWVASVGNIASGACNVVLGTSAFSTIYGCQAMPLQIGSTPSITSLDTTDFSIRGRNEAAGDSSAADYFIECWGLSI